MASANEEVFNAVDKLKFAWPPITANGDLAKALAEAQLEFQSVKKEKTNPYYGSKYADLADVIAATQKALAKHGLVIIQHPVIDPERHLAGVETVLLHESGQSTSSTLLLPATMKRKDGSTVFDAQSVGSAIQYARRYSYQSVTGVSAEDDDDGNAAVGGKSVKMPERKQPQPVTAPVLEEDPFLAEEAALSLGVPTKPSILKSPAEIKKVDAQKITEKQVKLIYARAKAAGMTSEDITQFINETFNCAPTDLNFKQLNQTLESIASMVSP